MSDQSKRLRDLAKKEANKYMVKLLLELADYMDSVNNKRKSLERTIEQQQQRIAELEAERDSVCHLNDSLSLERDELSAMVDVLRSISEAEYADEDERIADIQGALEATPKQTLDEVKREVAREAFIAGATDASAFISQQLDLGKTDIDLDAGVAADKYVKTKYPSGEDGEQ